MKIFHKNTAFVEKRNFHIETFKGKNRPGI